MERDRRRFDDRRGGESYRPAERSGRSPSRGYDSHSRRRSPPRNRSRPRADTWVPSNRSYGRPRSRSPDFRRRSRTPPFQGRGFGPGSYGRRRSPPRRFSPRRDDRNRSPPRTWRSRSPLNTELRPRALSRSRNSPWRATLDPSPGSRDLRTAQPVSPASRHADRPLRGFTPDAKPSQEVSRSQDAPDADRREQVLHHKERASSRSRQGSTHPMSGGDGAGVGLPVTAPDSGSRSRRSSPSVLPDRSRAASIRSRSRSPTRRSPSFRPPTGPRGRSPNRELRRDSDHLGPRWSNDDPTERPAQIPTGPSQLRDGRSSNSIPTQPRNASIQAPPSGPSQGSKMGAIGPGRVPQNMSLLSAPTRPRRGHGSRDGPWHGPPMARRGPPPAPAGHGPPAGPRASFSSSMSGGGGHYRHSGARQHSTASAYSSPGPKPPNHLSGLSAIIPGGKLSSSILDPPNERRLAQLEADCERLNEQVLEIQKIKRAGLRDWDRLDRESSICALKSELAEGHLQRMAEENSIAGGVSF